MFLLENKHFSYPMYSWQWFNLYTSVWHGKSHHNLISMQQYATALDNSQLHFYARTWTESIHSHDFCLTSVHLGTCIGVGTDWERLEDFTEPQTTVLGTQSVSDNNTQNQCFVLDTRFWHLRLYPSVLPQQKFVEPLLDVFSLHNLTNVTVRE